MLVGQRRRGGTGDIGGVGFECFGEEGKKMKDGVRRRSAKGSVEWCHGGHCRGASQRMQVWWLLARG